MFPRIGEVLGNAREYGVEYFGVPGTTLTDSKQVLALVRETSPPACILAACGVHPYHAAEDPLDSPEQVELLRGLISDSACRAVGECGLDYSDGFPPREIQLRCFQQQLALALEIKKPLYLHVREAHEDFMGMMAKHGYSQDTSSSLPTAAAVHCFTGTLEELEDYVSCGYFIGLTGHIAKFSHDMLKSFLQVAISPPFVLIFKL